MGAQEREGLMREPRKAPTWDTDPGVRWEQGYDHHPASIQLHKELDELDWKHLKGYFDFKSGGDGDNGETLMFLLDMIFERRDAAVESKT